MHTKYGHLTYCTNIHPGETWDTHFGILRSVIPGIRKQMAGEARFGIGLRLSNTAAGVLSLPEQLEALKAWLLKENCYVFTMNGFPYGGFHHTRVKDEVHAPDWTQDARVKYTLQLFTILEELLEEGMDGGVSTSPLSYKPWFITEAERSGITRAATENILKVVRYLDEIYTRSGKVLHLDVEPEPDGMLESGAEFIDWYLNELIPLGVAFFSKRGIAAADATGIIKRHVQLCYDVCHFAVGYEDHATILGQLEAAAIRVGKIQVSAALKADFNQQNAEAVLSAFRPFDEPVYLHQVVERQKDGVLRRYSDLPEAISNFRPGTTEEWRAHFHVPVFVKEYGLLQSTQEDIIELFRLHTGRPMTSHLEVETYTWSILPSALKLPVDASVVRELKWVHQQLTEADHE